MYRGYIALYRKYQDHPFWKEKRVFSKAEAWIDLIWEAQHDEKSHQVVIKFKTLICNYGESLKSMETWAARWGWNKSRVKRFFNLLENMNQIRYANETITTRITILNYSEYDPKRNGNRTQTKRKRNASETVSITDNNVNNEKNENKAIVPDWLDLDLWKEFKKHRIKIRKPMTEKAEQLLISKITHLKEEGHNPKYLLITAIERGWQTVFAPTN